MEFSLQFELEKLLGNSGFEDSTQCKIEPVSDTEVTEPCDTKLRSKKTNEVVDNDNLRFECTHCEKDFSRNHYLRMHIQLSKVFMRVTLSNVISVQSLSQEK